MIVYFPQIEISNYLDVFMDKMVGDDCFVEITEMTLTPTPKHGAQLVYLVRIRDV